MTKLPTTVYMAKMSHKSLNNWDSLEINISNKTLTQTEWHKCPYDCHINWHYFVLHFHVNLIIIQPFFCQGDNQVDVLTFLCLHMIKYNSFEPLKQVVHGLFTKLAWQNWFPHGPNVGGYHRRPSLPIWGQCLLSLYKSPNPFWKLQIYVKWKILQPQSPSLLPPK